MPVFLEYLYTFFEERNSRNGQDRGKAHTAPQQLPKKRPGNEGREPSLTSGAERERCVGSEHPHLGAALEAEKPVLQITWQPGAWRRVSSPHRICVTTTEPACVEGLLCA